MSLSKRIFVIIILIMVCISLFLITKIYERKINLNKEKEIYEPFKNVIGYKNKNLKRYISYYNNNKKLSYEDIVTKVNIGLDYDFYTFIDGVDTSKNSLLLVNKYNVLNRNYIPLNLEEIDSKYFINGNENVRKMKKEAKEAFEKLSEESIKNGTPVYGQSGYRSYEKQEDLYNNAKKVYGIEKADSDTARAGHSEHQSGLAIDVSSTKNGNMLTFEFTPSFNWMKNNAYKYGFILRYPRGKEDVHGYISEPWHYRYVGIKIATDMYDNYSDLCFDEYYYMFIDK